MKDICRIRLLSSGPAAHFCAYPTCHTWSSNGDRLFVVSTDSGANGGSVSAIDTDTGEITHLVCTTSNGYCFDYSRGANCILYIDDGGTSLRALNLDTGRCGLLFTETEGHIGDPPTISTDGTRAAYWCSFPSIANRYFDDCITAIMALDLDPRTCELVREPWVVEAYPRRKNEQWARNPKHGVHVNHPQINPANRDHICYSHEMRGAVPDGSPTMCRLWQVMADGSDNRPLVRQPAGLHFTHEVIAADGRSLVFPYWHGVGQVDFGTFERRSLFYNPVCCPGHITVSPDGRWIAGDTWGEAFDDLGRRVQSLMMFEVKSRRWANLCWMLMSGSHPNHPHPSFSPDGRQIAFTVLVDGVPQAALIDVGPVMDSWDDYAEGVGEEVSPQWR